MNVAFLRSIHKDQDDEDDPDNLFILQSGNFSKDDDDAAANKLCDYNNEHLNSLDQGNCFMVFFHIFSFSFSILTFVLCCLMIFEF